MLVNLDPLINVLDALDVLHKHGMPPSAGFNIFRRLRTIQKWEIAKVNGFIVQSNNGAWRYKSGGARYDPPHEWVTAEWAKNGAMWGIDIQLTTLPFGLRITKGNDVYEYTLRTRG